MNKAFTLIELLAVIAILAIVLLIAVPKVLDTINSSKKASFIVSAQLLAKAGDNYFNDNLDTITKPANGTGLVVTVTQLKTAGYIKNINSITNSVIVIYNSNNKYYIYIFATDGTYIVDGYTSDYIKDNTRTGSTNYTSLITSSSTYCSSGSKLALSTLDTSCASAPEMSSNMIPIYYDSTNSVWKKADVTNLNATYQWYDYTNKKWANAVTVTASTLSTYQNAAVGTTVAEADILTYMVWIPRYSYYITTGGTTTPSSINIKFENASTTKSTGNATTTYLTHPAFTFGTKELNGIWVGKFEITGAISAITVKPNITSLRSQSVSIFYTAIKNMEASGNLYGYIASEVDTHMMLNSEWGAVAYLTNSIYGFNQEVWINNSSTFTTGCAGATVSAASYAGCANGYNTTLGVNASTTGNVYGIYDMAGGAYDYVMGNYNNGSGYSSTVNSGFSGYNGNDLTTTVGLAFPDGKYYNLYTTSTKTTACSGGICYGHALSETSGWNSDSTSFVNASNPWFLRGGSYAYTASAGLFCFENSFGNASSVDSTHIVQIET